MADSSFQFSVSSNGYFIIPSIDGENVALWYVDLVAKILSALITMASSALIFITMALTSKLRTAVDIVFSQIIISSVMITTVNWSYQSYLRWRVRSRQSTVVCLFLTSIAMASYIMVLASYLSVAVMQLVIVKKGMQSFRKVFTRRIACMASVGMWVVSITVCGVIVAGRYGNRLTYIYDPATQACYSHTLSFTSFNQPISLGTTIGSSVCVAATFICYAITIWTLRSQVPPNRELKSRTTKQQNYGIEQLSSRTRQKLTASIKRIIALMSMYMVCLLPSGVITSLSAVSQTSQLYIYQQVAYVLSTLGITAYFPVYIISHSPRRRACYLLLTGRHQDIKFTI